MNKELQDYIDTVVRPSSRKIIRDAAMGMSEQQQIDFLKSLQMGDAEFQQEVAPRTARSGMKLDPAKARVEATDFPLNLRGLSAGEKNTKTFRQSYRGADGKMKELEFPPGSVTAVGYHNATPDVWAHEYRHQEDKDPIGGEYYNRVLDVVGSVNPSDFRRTVASLLSGRLRELRSKYHKTKDEQRKQHYKQEFEALADMEVEVESSDESPESIMERLGQVAPEIVEQIMKMAKEKTVEPTALVKNILGIRDE